MPGNWHHFCHSVQVPATFLLAHPAQFCKWQPRRRWTLAQHYRAAVPAVGPRDWEVGVYVFNPVVTVCTLWGGLLMAGFGMAGC